MKKTILTIILFGGLIINLYGCGPKLPSIALSPQYPIGALEDTVIKPTAGNLKIFLQQGSNPNVSSQSQQLFSTKVTQLVTSSGSEVIDRSQAVRLQKEIELKLMSGDYKPYEGPSVADYVIISTITGTSSSSQYTKRSSYVSDGKTIVSPAYCNYYGKADGQVEIRLLPTLERLGIVTVKGNNNIKIEGHSSRCSDRNALSNAVVGAINGTLNKGEDNYMNLVKFVGSQGMVIGARKHDGKIYFETNLGRIHGAKKEAKVKIYQIMDGELIEVAEGQMLGDKNILQKRSFFTLDNKSDLPNIKQGMIVKLSGDCSSTWGCFSNISNNFINDLVN